MLGIDDRSDDPIAVDFTEADLPRIERCVPEQQSTLLVGRNGGIAHGDDRLDCRWAFEEAFCKSADYPDGKAKSPEQCREHHANDGVFPNEPYQSRDRIEDHEGKNKERDAPEDPSVPDSQLNSRVEVQADQKDPDVHRDKDTAAEVFAQKQQASRQGLAQEQVERTGLEHIGDHRCGHDDGDHHGDLA